MSIDRFELRSLRYEVEQGQRWQDEVARLPWIQFPSDWKVKVVPPYGDAVVRFFVTLPDGKEKSVYYDSRASLGMYFGGGDELVPYWEVYPVNGDIGRCGTDEVELLLEMIAEGSEEKEETNMNEWTTDCKPTSKDAPNGYVWTTNNDRTGFSRWDAVKDGVPWMPMLWPAPYEKPKRYTVKWLADCQQWAVMDRHYVATRLPKLDIECDEHREAAERIAAIYEEVVP